MENPMTLDQAIDTVLQLPPEQQEILVAILHSRHIDARRREIAADAADSLDAFRRGELPAHSADSIIA